LLNDAFLALAPLADSEAGDGQLTSILILAVIQGLTEFLPVSSSGHLVLGREALGLHSISGALVTIALHVGTLLAVLVVYGRDLLGVLRRALTGRPRDLLMIALGSVPAAAVGLGLGDRLDVLFESPQVAAWGLLATALILVAGDLFRRRRELAGAVEGDSGLPPGSLNVSPGQALLIGVAQAFAIVPGVSRSGSTICAGLVLGHSATDAARFSFLLSLPVIGGAALLELKGLGQVDSGTVGDLLLGLVVSGLVGLAALRLLLVALRRGSLPWFAAYCATVSALWFALG